MHDADRPAETNLQLVSVETKSSRESRKKQLDSGLTHSLCVEDLSAVITAKTHPYAPTKAVRISAYRRSYLSLPGVTYPLSLIWEINCECYGFT